MRTYDFSVKAAVGIVFIVLMAGCIASDDLGSQKTAPQPQLTYNLTLQDTDFYLANEAEYPPLLYSLETSRSMPERRAILYNQEDYAENSEIAVLLKKEDGTTTILNTSYMENLTLEGKHFHFFTYENKDLTKAWLPPKQLQYTTLSKTEMAKDKNVSICAEEEVKEFIQTLQTENWSWNRQTRPSCNYPLVSLPMVSPEHFTIEKGINNSRLQILIDDTVIREYTITVKGA